MLYVVKSCAMPNHEGVALRKYAIYSADHNSNHLYVLCLAFLRIECIQHLAASAGQQATPAAQRQLACSVFLQDDAPMLHVVESCAKPDREGIALRKYAIHSVDPNAAPFEPPPAKSGGQAITQSLSELTCLADANSCLCQIMSKSSHASVPFTALIKTLCFLSLLQSQVGRQLFNCSTVIASCFC